jgi:hypothetical protein
MSKTLSMTLPDRVHAALSAHAKREFDMEPSELLRHFLITASTCPQGAMLKLDLPPVMLSADPEQPQLPLGGG